MAHGFHRGARLANHERINSMYDTILIPTDGSEGALRAAEHGAYLARLFDADVHLLSVVDLQAAAGPFDAGGVDRAFVERLEDEGEEALDDVERAVEDAIEGGGTIKVERAVERGRPSETILEYVEEHGVDVVAMGTHGRTGVRRYVAGSVTERVLRLADVPVLTVRATERSRVTGDYEEILVPTDGSEAASAAVQHGLAIAQHTGARVHAVNVVDADAVAAGEEPPAGLETALEEEGRRATEAIADRARRSGLDAVAETRTGTPAKALLAYVEESDIDLVGMGTTGRTGLNRYLLGSTTERIVRHADVPVLAVNARERSGT
jgi:nucleotide-binding universal stress UspA family protein